jgi:hypothetical protein
MSRVLDAAGFDPLEKNIREVQRAMAAGVEARPKDRRRATSRSTRDRLPQTPDTGLQASRLNPCLSSN